MSTLVDPSYPLPHQQTPAPLVRNTVRFKAATMSQDVPSSVDYRKMDDAREWEQTATSRRPWRTECFDQFVAAIESSPVPVRRVLELGSGPGFLAAHVLQRIPDLEYVALDFSAAMHALAGQRLGALAGKVTFVERSFKEPGWGADLGPFECVVTNQAVHELRHKRHAAKLHSEVRQLLVPGGSYLVCDHFLGSDGMANDQLYMTTEEQRAALEGVGFSEVTELWRKGGLVLHRAR